MLERPDRSRLGMLARLKRRWLESSSSSSSTEAPSGATPMRDAGSLAQGATGGASLAGRWMRREEAIMGTSIVVELWSDDERRGQEALDAVIVEMHRIDASMSPYKPESELSVVNRDAGRGPVRISEELFALLSRSIEFSELSDGAFDITYAGAGHLYDYRRGVRPSDAELARARETIGYRMLVLDAAARTVRFARDGMRIDLGGFAKGYAVDRGAGILRALGVAHAIVTAGGDSHIVGDRRGRPWSIGIRDPRAEDKVVAVLPLVDTALSTSGDYERYFLEGSQRHHHVIDPRTGRSASAVRSVTVVGPDGLTTEAMTKTIFVLGWREGLRRLERMPGLDAVVVDDRGELHASSGLVPGTDTSK